jgi:trans-2,3-dihydro-3-hydroxyanthranilate isomerase
MSTVQPLAELSVASSSNADRAPRVFEYAQVDVFAERPLEGNALAIFTDARGLSSEEMQALARETNLCETTFILPRPPEVERERGVQVRIFTVREELQFAGHPTLGSASWLYLNHPVLQGAEQIMLDLRVGQIPVRFDAQLEEMTAQEVCVQPGVFGTMRQNDPTFGAIHDRVEVAKAIGLAPEDLEPNLPIQTVSTGLPFCIVPLRSMEVAARLAIPQPSALAYLAKSDAKFFHCITGVPSASGADWHARMQFYGGEDPATGSASGCAISYLVRHAAVPSGKRIVIEQGVEMLRPSRIYVQASLGKSQTGNLHSQVTDVFVGGRTIPVASGRIILPGYTGNQQAGAAKREQ